MADPEPIAPAADPAWIRPTFGSFSFIIFGAAGCAAYLAHDEGLLNLMIGAAIANVTTVIGYYFGSSSGSHAKDGTIAVQAKNGADA